MFVDPAPPIGILSLLVLISVEDFDFYVQMKIGNIAGQGSLMSA